ncbi:MAG: family 43 glycosylhydrolase [Lachnospiraceae bacterium]|nr:family 43 glycosylhydrolase [Lachnospiraceae bacterium]
MNNTELLKKYINANDLINVKKMLIEEPSLIEGSHLFAAAKCGHFEIVKYLVEYSRISLNEKDDHGRDVLHYCALSGNAGLWDYLISKCGMSPFTGDDKRITAWEIADQNGSTDICLYMNERYGDISDYYKNPVRTGMFPDPSIVRVGDDYYMVNSSFIFFPCIPVSHSTDLIHWEIIGHAITDPGYACIDDLEGGRGYWAPDISYYEGRFYITATLRYNDDPPVYRRQIVVSSDKPEGPYSKPAYIEEDGIDPSIFNDDDGRRYMLLNRGARILELDKSGTKQISPASLLMYGDMKRAPEGPHLYKKDGYYYLILAEGGTGTGHRVTAFRSKTLKGDYEKCPYNPIMRQDDPLAPLQRCGHGDMVETPDGRWYMVYLCGRMLEGKYSILGRETALDPVTWTKDGWPVVNGLEGPSVLQKKPYPQMDVTGADITSCDYGNKDGDLHDEAELKPGIPTGFVTPRTYNASDISYSVCNMPGEKTGYGLLPGTCGYDLLIRPSRYDLSQTACRSVVLRRQTAFKFEVSVTIPVPDDMAEGEEIGLTGYYDENTYCVYALTLKSDVKRLCVKEHIGDTDMSFLLDVIEDGVKSGGENSMHKIRIEMKTDGLIRDMYLNGRKIYTLENVYYLCDEGLSRGKRFTGAMIGVYATGRFEENENIRREFKAFCYKDISEKE